MSAFDLPSHFSKLVSGRWDQVEATLYLDTVLLGLKGVAGSCEVLLHVREAASRGILPEDLIRTVKLLHKMSDAFEDLTAVGTPFVMMRLSAAPGWICTYFGEAADRGDSV